MDTQVAVVAEDVQVAAKPRRRTYTAEYKRRILKEAEACATPGAVGALLRREGLYSSHLVVWRRARARGELAALAPKQRGRKPAPVDARDRKIAEAHTTVEETRREMEGLRADYQTRIARVEADARARIQAAIREAQAERERVLAEARARSETALREGVAVMDREKNEALTSLRDQIVDVAAGVVAKAMGLGIDAPTLRSIIASKISETTG